MLTLPKWCFTSQAWQRSATLLLTRLVAGFYSLHSPRNWLVSNAAVFGVDPQRRQYCGRWSVVATDEYTRTAREIVHSVQEWVARALRSKDKRFTEESALLSLKDYLIEQGATDVVIAESTGSLCCLPFLFEEDDFFRDPPAAPGL